MKKFAKPAVVSDMCEPWKECIQENRIWLQSVKNLARTATKKKRMVLGVKIKLLNSFTKKLYIHSQRFIDGIDSISLLVKRR